MKSILFISYSNENLNKVKLITKELSNHPLFEPLIVANNREPNKALVNKVTKGIKSAYRIIAILTEDSIKAQWINQEIGYANGKGIKVIPIVEEKIMDDLKGFIHKQNDLPYTYKTRVGISMRDENKSFMSCFRQLIEDLEIKHKKKFENEEIKTSPKFVLKTGTILKGTGKALRPISESLETNPMFRSVGSYINSKDEPVKAFARIVDSKDEPVKAYSASILRKPLGISVFSGEKCPESGIWISSSKPPRKIDIKEGKNMPFQGTLVVDWKLIQYS